MVFTSPQEKKKQQMMIVVIIVMIIGIVFTLWWGYFRRGTPPTFSDMVNNYSLSVSTPEIKLNFDILSDPRVQKLQSYQEITFSEEEATGTVKIGRNNPFIPF